MPGHLDLGVIGVQMVLANVARRRHRVNVSVSRRDLLTSEPSRQEQRREYIRRYRRRLAMGVIAQHRMFGRHDFLGAHIGVEFNIEHARCKRRRSAMRLDGPQKMDQAPVAIVCKAAAGNLGAARAEAAACPAFPLPCKVISTLR